MKLFLQRLCQLLFVVVLTAFVVGVCYGLAWLCSIVQLFGNVLGVIWIVAVTSFILYAVYKFIHWLFIEPFRKGGGRS